MKAKKIISLIVLLFFIIMETLFFITVSKAYPDWAMICGQFSIFISMMFSQLVVIKIRQEEIEYYFNSVDNDE